MAIDKQLIYEVLSSDTSKYRASIQMGSTIITGVLNAPVPLAAGNDFQSVKNAFSDAPVIGTVMKAGEAVSNVLKVTGNDTTLSIQQTRKIWQESKMPVLTLELTFWAMSVDDALKPLDKVNKIYQGLFPIKRDSFLIGAPLGYKLSDSNANAQGTVSITVGDWLLARGLVMTDANFTPSLEVLSDGTPLYCTGTVSFEPYRMITYQEYLGWFKKSAKEIQDVALDDEFGEVK